MNRLRQRAVDNFHALPHGGLEIGGILFGRVNPNARTPLRVEIAAERPIACSHSAGPAFILNADEQNEISSMLERSRLDAEIAPLSILGFWASHGRSQLALTPDDLELYKKLFPHPWQIVMVLKPANGSPTRGAYFYRAGGRISPHNPQHDFYAEPHLATVPPNTGDVPSSARYQPVVREKREEPPPPEPPPAPAPRVASRVPLSGLAFFLAAAAIAGSGLTYFAVNEVQWSPGGAPRDPPVNSSLNLELFSAGDSALVHWNANSAEIESASHGELDIEDGGSEQTVPLNLPRLRIGHLRIKANSPNVSATLKIYEQNGAVAQATSRLTEK